MSTRIEQQQKRRKQYGLETVLLGVGPADDERLDRLASTAIDLAGPSGATVVLGHVFSGTEYRSALDRLDFDVVSSEVSPDDVAERYSTVRDLAARLDAAGVDYEIRGAVGERGEKLVALAEQVGADRVVVGGRQRSPTGKAVFGSVAQAVLLSSPCPVTFVRADAE